MSFTQEIRPSSIVEYANDGAKEVPTTKREFVYDVKGHIVEESFYYYDESSMPFWKLYSKKQREFTNSGELYIERTLSYYLYDEMQSRSVLASINEQRTVWTEDRTELNVLTNIETFNESGDQIGCSAFRSINYYDSNGCYIGNISYENVDPKLSEETWIETWQSERITDALCRIVSEMSYRRGRLRSTIIAEYDKAGNLT